jgi:hypothetical protein
MKYRVTVQASAIVEADIVIEAASKEEAERAALRQSQVDPFEEIGWEVTEIENPPDVILVKEDK